MGREYKADLIQLWAIYTNYVASDNPTIIAHYEAASRLASIERLEAIASSLDRIALILDARIK